MGIRTTIIENNFSKNNTASYKLSFLLGEDSFFYCVHTKGGELLLLKEFQQDTARNRAALATALASTMVSDKNLSLPYGEVKAVFAGAKSCFIPSRLFHPSKAEVYLNQLTPVENAEEVKTEELLALDTHHVFSIEKSLWNAVRRTFPIATCSHVVSSLGLAFQKIAKKGKGKQVFVNTRSQKAQVFVFEQQQLLFGNTFSFQSSKDFIYYVLLVYEQLKLSIEDDPLRLSGAIMENSEIYNLLYRYVQEVHFLELPQDIRLGQEFKEKIPPHFYFDLLTI